MKQKAPKAKSPEAVKPGDAVKPVKADFPEQVRSFVAEWSVTIILLLFGTTTLLQAFVVPTGSMEDTVLIGDHMFVDKLSYSPAGPVSKYLLPYTPVQRGDIIVFKWPIDTRQNYVKRVVGVPGDRIKLVNKDLYLNGKKVTEPYVVHKSPMLDSYRDMFPTETNTRLEKPANRILADTVKEAPKSYADLWTPEFISAGRMVTLDDSRVGIGATLLTLGYDVNTTDDKQLEEAKAKLSELAKGITLYDSDSPKTALIAGDVDLGITWTGEAFLAAQENPAITYVYPTEGVIVWQDNYAMPKDAPHADAAYAWLNYTMQPDLFWLMLRDFPYTNPSQGALEYAKSNTMKVLDVDGNETTPADLYTKYIESPITNTPPEALKAGHRIEDVGDALPKYDQIWTEIKQ